MSVALESFVKQLTDSGIIAPGKLENFVPPKAHPRDADELAEELVKSNLLTNFQAHQIKVGKVKALFLGGYTILDKIGAGGMGQVFKAQHRRMDRIVAIKMLPAKMTKDAAAAARFEREVRAAAKLEHPNIVTAYDADQANGVHFLVMQYVEGNDLSVLVKKNGPFPVAKAVNYILQAARGLEFAHGEGVIHRDIKPANLLLDKKGVVKILDMGLARIETAGEAANQAELTGTGAIMGTVDYMAPEQAVSTKDADARADIYSLGCSLYYLIAGRPTYGGETVMGKMLAHRESPIPALRNVVPDIPEELEAVFKKMVAKKREGRYQTMTEVVADLEKCSGDQSTSHSPSIQQSVNTNLDNSALTFLKSIPAQTIHQTKATHQAATGARAIRRRPPVKWFAAAAVLGVALLAGIIVSLRSGDHNLVVEVNEPDAVVTISNTQGKVKITRKSDKTPILISVDPGKHRLKVEKDGFQFLTQDFTVEAEGQTTLKARLVPVKKTGGTGQPDKPWNTPAFQQWMKDVAKLPGDKQVEAVAKKLQELNPGFDGMVAGADGKAPPRIENGVVTGLFFFSDNVTDISPVRALLGLKHLECGGSRPGASKLSDLSSLQGMPLVTLWCGHSQISNLSPLKGMPLTKLVCSASQVSDLSPLKGMALNEFYAGWIPISDLSPLEDCKNLKTLDVTKTKVTPASVAALQKALPNCKIEWDGSAKPITNINDPAFQTWMRTVAAMPAEKQVEAVANKLMELNPGFDGKQKHKVENDAVTELQFITNKVTDIFPVKLLVGLRILNCSGSSGRNGTLSDLSPLKGMALRDLSCYHTQVADISPLRGMPLRRLDCNTTQVSDLSPLEECKSLTLLNVKKTKVIPAGVAALQKALPNCQIEWDDPAKATTQPAPAGTK